MRRVACLLYFALAMFSIGWSQSFDDKKFHFEALVVDTHNDVVQRILNGEDISVRTTHGHSDLPRFREGGLDVQVFSIWVPPEKTAPSYYDQTNQQIDSIESLIRRAPSEIGLARSVHEIQQLSKSGKFVAMLGIEGGHSIEDDLTRLDHFYNRGVRYMTLTWNNSTAWATSAKDETANDTVLPHTGLTEFGRTIVRRMNELGMMVDISHVGEQTFRDVMATTRKPVIASHSSAWALVHHRRNLKDDQLKAIKKNNGVVFINFAPWFIDSTFGRKEAAMKERNAKRIDSLRVIAPRDEFMQEVFIDEGLKEEYAPIRPTFQTLMDHFDYVAKLIGVDHVGIGSDFDGISVTPAGMDDVTFYPQLTRELFARGYTENDVRKILGENFLRVLREVERR